MSFPPLPTSTSFTFTPPPPPHTARARQIHRNRISYSCHACRRRKIKCDRQHPLCGNCTKTNESCVYDEHAKTPVNKDGGSNDGKDGKEREKGTKRRRTNDGSEGNGNGTTGMGLGVSAGKESELETRMNRLAEIVDRWYKDASSSRSGNQAPSGQNTTVGSEASIGGSADNSFTQTQAYLYLLKQATEDPGLSDSPSPPGLSPGASATPGSSHDSDSAPWAPPDSQTAVKILSDKIDVVNANAVEADDVDDLGIGHLSIQGGGRSRYVGSSFWGLLSSEITELNEILKTHTHFDRIGNKEECEAHFKSNPAPQPTLAPPPPPPPTDINPGGSCPQAVLAMFNKASFLQFEPRAIETRTCEVIPAILKSLPNKPLAAHLYASFLHGVHPVMPLLHAPTFDEEYRYFWSWYPDNAHHFPDPKLTENPTFLPLLMAVLYAGAISMSSKRITRLTNGEWTKETLSARLYGATMSALAACAFPRSPTVYSLISFLIVQTCLIREEEPLTSCSFVGMAMRVAQSMGLHRDGSLFGLPEIECEVRRRVWWHIMYLDVQGAIATGLPPLGGSGVDLYDTKMVSELRDEYIGLPLGAPDPVTPMTPHNKRCQEFHVEKLDVKSSPAMILAVGRYESTILLRTIITRLFTLRGSRRSKSDLMEMSRMIYELKMKIEKKISQIPARGIPEMGFIPPIGSHDGLEVPGVVERAVVFNSWARIMLSLLSDRAFGVLYQPFLKSAKSSLWKHARNCALHFCHSFLRKFLHLSLTPLFQPFQWFCPGTYQPLHATMILILDLHERPFAPEAPKSRGFVDQVFAVFGQNGNYSTADGEGGNRPLMEGGREAWRMLWRLRRKAYERAGVAVPEEPVRAEAATGGAVPRHGSRLAPCGTPYGGGGCGGVDMFTQAGGVTFGGCGGLNVATHNIGLGTSGGGGGGGDGDGDGPAKPSPTATAPTPTSTSAQAQASTNATSTAQSTQTKPYDPHYYPNFSQYVLEQTTAVTAPPPSPPTPPPFPPVNVPEHPNTSFNGIAASGFEELLHMDTVIDAEDKAFYTDAVAAHFLQHEEAEAPEDLGFGLPDDDLTGSASNDASASGFSAMGGEGSNAGGEDMMEFDWEEWDQVFGKYVAVDEGEVL